MAIKKKLLNEAIKTAYNNIPLASKRNDGLFRKEKYWFIPEAIWLTKTYYRILISSYFHAVLIIDTNVYILRFQDYKGTIRKICGIENISFKLNIESNILYIHTESSSPMISFSVMYGNPSGIGISSSEDFSGEDVMVLE